MAIKSTAQRAKIQQLKAEGKIAPEVADKMELERPNKLTYRAPRPHGRQQFASMAKKAKVLK
jgi:hypothetical protein